VIALTAVNLAGIRETKGTQNWLTVLEVAGVVAVNNMMSVDQSAPEATYYTVVSGDNLSKISKAHYGDPNKYMVIFDANKPMLTHPDKIYPGQVLRIPPL